MKFLKPILVSIGGLIVLYMLFLAYRSYKAQDLSPKLGINESGSLQPCPPSPNCVSSESEDEGHSLPPWELKPTVPTSKVFEKLISASEKVGNVEWIVKPEGEDYLYGVFRTPIFRFPDDLEFVIDSENSLLHFRSSSRVGYSDMGTNKKRLLAIKKEVAEILEN